MESGSESESKSKTVLMELEIWPSGLLLPSVDARCLQFLAYARICAAPFKLVRGITPWASPDGTYPVFKHGKHEIFTGSEANQLVDYLRTHITDCSLDYHLNAEERAQISPYESLLKLKLEPAYLYFLWMDIPNYNTFTTKWYCSQLPIGYGMYYVAKQRRSAVNHLRSLYPGKLTGEENIEFAVTKQALLCINLLSAKLGEKKYFFGDKPSSLDALVFGYLAPLLKLPLPDDRLQLHIKACPNLVRFVDTMISVYMPLAEEEMTSQREEMKEWEKRKEKAQSEIQRSKQRAKQDSQESTSEDFPLMHKIMFAVGAVVLSLLVALHTGLIQVEVREVNKEDNGHGPDED